MQRPSTSQNQAPVANLRAWWNNFTSQKGRKDHVSREDEEVHHTVFGKPLKESLGYASVQISTANSIGELYVWGSIPVVVAKCGLYLKENATEVQGTFRVNGSNKRMRELQAVFENPPRYGKSLNWSEESYTTHDVASVFRRYLTQMPEPVIPHDLYHAFRDALAKTPHRQDDVITTYKSLIRSMPLANQHLLLYVLDLLSVFARKSDKNLMTAANLAVIFRPGLISHPNHEMSPQEHQLSQQVLEFLIAHQDWFMLDTPSQPQVGMIATPPQHPRGPPDSEDFHIVPSSDEEFVHAAGWKQSSKDKKKLARRRTLDKGVPQEPATRPPRASAEAELSTVKESSAVADQPRSPGSPGVQRSRTLPSRREEANVEGSSSERARLLRKHKRASSGQQPRRSETSDSTTPG